MRTLKEGSALALDFCMRIGSAGSDVRLPYVMARSNAGNARHTLIVITREGG